MGLPPVFALTQGDIARPRSRLPYYLPPRQLAGFRIVLLLYEWFGATRLAALACYALAGRC